MRLDHAEQLAQVVGVAKSVLEVGVLAVGLEPVVNRDPGEVREHPGVIEPVKAALIVQRVERRLLGAGAKQPPQLAFGAGAGLVEVGDRRRGDLGVNLVQERPEVLGAAGQEGGQRAG